MDSVDHRIGRGGNGTGGHRLTNPVALYEFPLDSFAKPGFKLPENFLNQFFTFQFPCRRSRSSRRSPPPGTQSNSVLTKVRLLTNPCPYHPSAKWARSSATGPQASDRPHSIARACPRSLQTISGIDVGGQNHRPALEPFAIRRLDGPGFHFRDLRTKYQASFGSLPPTAWAVLRSPSWARRYLPGQTNERSPRI